MLGAGLALVLAMPSVAAVASTLPADRLCDDITYNPPVGKVGTFICRDNGATCGGGIWIDENSNGVYDEGDDEIGACIDIHA